MSITYDLDCGDETITLELLDDGTLITYGFDIESEMIAREMGFEPHPCFEAMDDALWQASNNGDIDIVEILLAVGSDVHTWYDSSLGNAAMNNHIDVVKILLEYGADVQANDNAAIQWAARHGHIDVVKILLKHGADVHANGDGALRLARENSHDDVVEILEDWIKDHG